MITFVGAGPGAEDLITVRGQRLLKEADIVIYAGSLVNPGLLKLCKEKCEIYNRSVRSDGEGPWGRKRNRTSAYRRSLPLWCDPRADG